MFSMGSNYFSPEYREPNNEEIAEMNFWVETGCVHTSYLEKVLGDQSVGVVVFPRNVSGLDNI